MDKNLQKQMAFNENLNKLLEETKKKKTFQLWYYLYKKKYIQEVEYFTLGKTQGTINGGKKCKLMVGCSSRHCPKRYRIS